MIYKKLTPGQRRIKRWRERRNKLVQKILDQDKSITSAAALKLVNKEMHKR